MRFLIKLLVVLALCSTATQCVVRYAEGASYAALEVRP